MWNLILITIALNGVSIDTLVLRNKEECNYMSHQIVQPNVEWQQITGCLYSGPETSTDTNIMKVVASNSRDIGVAFITFNSSRHCKKAENAINSLQQPSGGIIRSSCSGF